MLNYIYIYIYIGQGTNVAFCPVSFKLDAPTCVPRGDGQCFFAAIKIYSVCASPTNFTCSGTGTCSGFVECNPQDVCGPPGPALPNSYPNKLKRPLLM